MSKILQYVTKKKICAACPVSRKYLSYDWKRSASCRVICMCELKSNLLSLSSYRVQPIFLLNFGYASVVQCEISCFQHAALKGMEYGHEQWLGWNIYFRVSRATHFLFSKYNCDPRPQKVQVTLRYFYDSRKLIGGFSLVQIEFLSWAYKILTAQRIPRTKSGIIWKVLKL